MIKTFFLILTLLSVPPSDYASQFEWIKKGDKFFMDWDKDVNLLDHALTSYDREIENGDPKASYEAYWKKANVYITLGTVSENKKNKEEYFEKAKEMALHAIKIDTDKADGHFWYFASLGKLGETNGLLASMLTMSEMKKHIDRALEIDPNHLLALYGKAILMEELPSILGGDQKKSEELYKKVIFMDPDFSSPYLRLAKLYVKKGRDSEAMPLLKKIIEMENPTWKSTWAAIVRPKAIRELDRLNGQINIRNR